MSPASSMKMLTGCCWLSSPARLQREARHYPICKRHPAYNGRVSPHPVEIIFTIDYDGLVSTYDSIFPTSVFR